tara:strand:- start:219 stop:407 length:189 start_codon:yes stop_codon:yes gene_type:complete
MPPKKTGKKSGGGQKKMNSFMTAKEKARKANAEEFTYKNKEGVMKTYKRFETATGMVAYKEK